MESACVHRVEREWTPHPVWSPRSPGMSLVAQRLSLPSGPAQLRDCTSAVRAGASRSVLLESTSRPACGFMRKSGTCWTAAAPKYQNYRKKFTNTNPVYGKVESRVYMLMLSIISSFAVSYTYLVRLLPHCFRPVLLRPCSHPPLWLHYHTVPFIWSVLDLAFSLDMFFACPLVPGL